MLVGEGMLKMLSSCDIKFIKWGCFCFPKRKQEHNLNLDMCLKSKELEHSTEPIPSNNQGKLLQSGDAGDHNQTFSSRSRQVSRR